MHLMIDLETLGTNPNCVVTQIGWALFDPKAQDMITESGCFYLSPAEQIKRGRSVTWDTIAWWLGQNEHARNKMANSQTAESVTETLGNFINNFDWATIEGVWGHGATFDITIMEDLLYDYAYKSPWKYNAVRDTRTLFALRSHDKLPKSEMSHDAEEDAIVQAKHVQKIYHSLLNETGA